MISALLIKDLVYVGFSSRDLLRSSRAFKFSFLFIQVKALFEKITEFNFLLAGSRLIASVYFPQASSNFCYFINSFPSSFNCSHFLALFRASLHLLLSGSNLIPYVKSFLALALSPSYSSIIPFRYQKSGLELLAKGIVLMSVCASIVWPVLAKVYTLNICKFWLLGILCTK